MKKFLDANGILQRDGVDGLRLAIHDTPPEDGTAGSRRSDGKRRRAKQVKSVRDPNDARPTIRLAENEIERIVDEAELALIRADRGLYQRNNLIVSVGSEPAIAADESKIDVQRIFERGDYALLEDLSSAAHFEKFDARASGDGFVTTSPPMSIVKTMQQRKGRLPFPILSGVVNVPTMRAHGSLLVTPGYG
jgi:putative DNA primase/helicase